MNNPLLNCFSRAATSNARGLLLRFYDLTDYHLSHHSSTAGGLRGFASSSKPGQAEVSGDHKRFNGSAGGRPKRGGGGGWVFRGGPNSAPASYPPPNPPLPARGCRTHHAPPSPA